MHTEASFTEVNILTKYSAIIKKLASLKQLEIHEVQSEAWLLLASFDEEVVVTNELFEKKLLQKVINLSKSCGLGSGSNGGCVNSSTDKERNTIEIGYAESAEDALERKLEMLQKEVDLEAGISALPDRTQFLLQTLEAALTGREILDRAGSNLGVTCLSVLNRRISSEIKLACEPTTQECLF